MIQPSDGDALPLASPSLLEGSSLFLDLDGTLFELVDRPEDVVADDALRALLRRVVGRLDGRIAVISGRSIAQIEAMLGPVAGELALSGSHGSEHRWRGLSAQPARPASLDHAASRFEAFRDGRDGVLVEEKSFGVALHYRMAPGAEGEARRLAADLGATLDLEVQHGKMMVELRVPGGDKGLAVRRMMARPPMAGARPVFVGDDITDGPGFAAARELGGAAVLVGPSTVGGATHRLPDPAAVRAWLAAFAR